MADGSTPDEDGHTHGTPDSDEHHADGDDHAHGEDHHADSEDHHAHHAGDLSTVGYAVVTVSSTRSFDDDTAGDAIQSVVEGAGDEVITRELVGDDLDTIQATVNRLAGESDVDCLVTTGGTGVSPDDVTPEAVEPLFDKHLPGFGELFRTLSREEIGTQVLATRATAGVIEGVPVFLLPGSENAARLGAAELVTEQAAHLAGLARE